MNKDPYEAMVMDYWDEKTTPDQRDVLEKQLIQAGYSREELHDLKEFYTSLDQVKVPEPGDEMSAKFYEMLEAEIKSAAAPTAVQRFLGWFQLQNWRTRRLLLHRCPRQSRSCHSCGQLCR